MKMILTPKDKDFFDENGYIVINNAFSQNDITSFKRILDNLINQTLYKLLNKNSDQMLSIDYNLDSGFAQLNKIDPQHISNIQRIISRCPEFLKLGMNQIINLAVKKLLNMEFYQPLYITSNVVIFTNPKDDTQISTNIDIDWHLDTFFTIPKSRFLQAWAPLYHDADEEIGTLILCPGSNKVDPYEVKQKFDPNLEYNHRYFIEPSDTKQYKPISIKLKLGQLLIFDSRTIHRSGQNVSSHVRCSFISMYHNTAVEDFKPVSIVYQYRDLTPEGHFYETYGDEKAKERMLDYLAPTKSISGV